MPTANRHLPIARIIACSITMLARAMIVAFLFLAPHLHTAAIDHPTPSSQLQSALQIQLHLLLADSDGGIVSRLLVTRQCSHAIITEDQARNPDKK